MNILKIYRLLLEEFTALLHNFNVISKAPLSLKNIPMVHLLQYHEHKEKQSRTGEREKEGNIKSRTFCLILSLNHQPNCILIYSFYTYNFLEHSAGVLINNGRNKLGQEKTKVF